jgi:hypothetical protein
MKSLHSVKRQLLHGSHAGSADQQLLVSAMPASIVSKWAVAEPMNGARTRQTLPKRLPTPTASGPDYRLVRQRISAS